MVAKNLDYTVLDGLMRINAPTHGFLAVNMLTDSTISTYLAVFLDLA